jgi:hypothetical protein
MDGVVLMSEYIMNSKEKFQSVLDFEKNIYLSKTSLEYKLRNPFKNKTSKCYYTY